MKRSIKAIIATAAAVFMCAAPVTSAVTGIVATNSITASAADYPVALDYMGLGYAANGLLYRTTGSSTVELAGRITNVSTIKCPAKVIINNKQYSVTKIAAEAFRVATIDDHPDWINEYHHYIYTTSIHTVDLTDASNLTEIGDRAFQYQTFGTLKMPTSSKLRIIGNNAFEGCGNISTVKIPKTITEVRSSAFRYAGLTSVTFEGGSNASTNTKICNLAFANCPYLDLIVNDHYDGTSRKLTGSARNAFDGGAIKLYYHVTSNVSFSYTSYFRSCFNFA